MGTAVYSNLRLLITVHLFTIEVSYKRPFLERPVLCFSGDVETVALLST